MFHANFLTIDSSTKRLKIHKKVALFLRSPINDAYCGPGRGSATSSPRWSAAGHVADTTDRRGFARFCHRRYASRARLWSYLTRHETLAEGEQG